MLFFISLSNLLEYHTDPSFLSLSLMVAFSISLSLGHSLSLVEDGVGLDVDALDSVNEEEGCRDPSAVPSQSTVVAL